MCLVGLVPSKCLFLYSRLSVNLPQQCWVQMDGLELFLTGRHSICKGQAYLLLQRLPVRHPSHLMRLDESDTPILSVFLGSSPLHLFYQWQLAGLLLLELSKD